MRVVLLSAANSIHTIRWANAFVQRGHAVHLVSQHAPGKALAAAVKVHRLPHRSGLGYLLNGPRLKALIAEIEPDVVNAHYATGYGTLARAVVQVPVVLNVWGSDVFDFPGKSPLHRWWLQRNLKHARCLVSTSEVMAERTRALCPTRPVEVVPFGVDTDQFRPAARDPQATVTIGTVKTLEATYGVDRLIEAFAILRRDGRDVRLRIVGGGSLLGALQEQVRAAGLQGEVDLVGAVSHDRVPSELQALDVYVALSRAESFGVAVIEASSCGLPVVVSDAGGLPEVVVDGVTGHVVPNGDPTLAAARLAGSISDAGSRKRMGEAGRKHVMAHYAWGACVDRMLVVLDRIARA